MRLLAVPGMRAYYLAATLARGGDEMVGFALIVLVLERTGDPVLAGVTGAAYALPAIASGPLLGAWLDRTDLRRAMLGLGQAVIGAVMLGMLAVVGSAPTWVTPALAAVAGTMLPMVSGGFTSMLPSLVPGHLLARANAAEAASFGAASMAGPAAAATVAATVSIEAAVMLIAVTVVLSLVALTAVPAVRPVAGVEHPPILAAALDGLRTLLTVAPLRASTIASTLSLGAIGMLAVALPLHVETLGAQPAASGYVWTAVEAGSVATALLLGRWQHRWRPERTVIASAAAFGAGLAAWPFATGMAQLVALAAVAGLLQGPMVPAMFGARQRYSPPELQGRVSTSAASVRVGVFAVGQAAGGHLVTALGTHGVLVAVACVQVAAALAGLLCAAASRRKLVTDSA